MIVGVGAGISIEKTMQEAEEIISKRLEGLEKTKMAIQQRFSQVAQKINDNRAKLDKLAAEVRKGSTSTNV